MDASTLHARLVAGAWRGADLQADPSRWTRAFPASCVDPLRRAAEAWRESSGDEVLAQAWTHPWPLPSEIEALGRSWARSVVQDGPGVLRVRGVPHDPADPALGATCLGLLAQAMGTLRPQNPLGHRLTEVRDFKQPWADAATRAYRTGDALPFHVDGAEVAGLSCHRPARSGGLSMVASSHHVIAEVVRRRPDLVPWLTTPLPHDRHDEEAPGESPVFHETLLDEIDGRIEVFVVDWYIRRAVRHPGVEVPEDAIALLDLIEAIAREPGVALTFRMEPGDVQWLHNRRVLHARGPFEDGTTPATQRLLHRVWLESVSPR